MRTFYVYYLALLLLCYKLDVVSFQLPKYHVTFDRVNTCVLSLVVLIDQDLPQNYASSLFGNLCGDLSDNVEQLNSKICSALLKMFVFLVPFQK